MRQILGLKPTRNLLEGKPSLGATGPMGQGAIGPKVCIDSKLKAPPLGRFFRLEAILLHAGSRPQGAGGTRGRGSGIRASKVSASNT